MQDVSVGSVRHSVARHPTQLYEATFHFSAAAVLYQLQQQGRFRGQLIKLYILSYLVFRFLTEFIRPEAHLWGELTGYQWVTLVLIPLFAWLWWRDQKRFGQSSQTPNQSPSAA